MCPILRSYSSIQEFSKIRRHCKYYEVVDIVLLPVDGLIRKDVHHAAKLQDAVPQLPHVGQLAHLFVQRRKFVNQPGNLRVIVLQPLYLFALDPPQDVHRVILYHLHPGVVEDQPAA